MGKQGNEKTLITLRQLYHKYDINSIRKEQLTETTLQEMNDYQSNIILDVALKVENLSKVYISSMDNVVYLRNVSFSVNKGDNNLSTTYNVQVLRNDKQLVGMGNSSNTADRQYNIKNRDI